MNLQIIESGTRKNEKGNAPTLASNSNHRLLIRYSTDIWYSNINWEYLNTIWSYINNKIRCNSKFKWLLHFINRRNNSARKRLYNFWIESIFKNWSYDKGLVSNRTICGKQFVLWSNSRIICNII